jgi:lambda family phage portal protein
MFNLENMDDAVLERQKIANLFAGFYEQNIDPESPDSMIDEMTDDGAETDDDEVPLAGLEPATMQELPPGYKATFSNPPSPGTDYSEFVRGHLLACASRQGVPYEVLTGDLRDVSDRALRLILNEFRRGLEMKQWLYFIPRWCQRIRTACLDMAHLSGALQLERYQERRAELIETLWVPQGWPYSHPVQDVTADLKAVRGGLTSRSERILSTGADPEKVDQDIAADNVRADKLGLVLDSDPRKVSNAGLTLARPAGTRLPATDVDNDESGGRDNEDTDRDEPSDDDDEQDPDQQETEQ